MRRFREVGSLPWVAYIVPENRHGPRFLSVVRAAYDPECSPYFRRHQLGRVPTGLWSLFPASCSIVGMMDGDGRFSANGIGCKASGVTHPGPPRKNPVGMR